MNCERVFCGHSIEGHNRVFRGGTTTCQSCPCWSPVGGSAVETVVASPSQYVEQSGLFHVEQPRETVAPAPFAAGSKTSRAAAKAVEGSRETQRDLVYQAIARSTTWGVTRDQLEVLTELPGDCIRPRVLELIELGNVTETAKTRPTRRGNRESGVLKASHFITTDDMSAGDSITKRMDHK